MKNISSSIKYLLSRDVVSVFYLVAISNDSVNIKSTTNASDFYMPSVGNFSSSDGLIVVEPPDNTSSIDRSSYKIAYADPEFILRPILEAGIIGARVDAYLGFINTVNNTALDDVLLIYSGSVDTYGYEINTSEGTVIASLECSSPMGSLGMKRGFYTTRSEIKQIDPSDTCFDQVTVGSKAIYAWGKM